MANLALIALTQEFHGANAAWTRLLPPIVNARYLPVGRGKPGSPLRAAYEKYRDAQRAFAAAWIDSGVGL